MTEERQMSDEHARARPIGVFPQTLTAHYPTGTYLQPPGNWATVCECGETLIGETRYTAIQLWGLHVLANAPAFANQPAVDAGVRERLVHTSSWLEAKGQKRAAADIQVVLAALTPAAPVQIPPPSWCRCAFNPALGADDICDGHAALGVGRAMDAEDGGYPLPAAHVQVLREALKNARNVIDAIRMGRVQAVDLTGAVERCDEALSTLPDAEGGSAPADNG